MDCLSFRLQSDTDLEVIFHCRRDFPEVKTTELHAKLDVVASSGGSNPNPTSLLLHREDDDGCDLENNRIFGELVKAVANSPHNMPREIQISEPKGVEETLCDDEEDEKPEFISGDSDDDHLSLPAERNGPSSSRSYQYSAHFSAMDLEAMAPSQEENNAGVGFGGYSNVKRV
ncbi:hypothetical protein PIB30_046734 [Stylosanthes scabra]|uniref:Uncharacterized protein n=1 Tax=Stylosanthes scabra TaxID=79078 RepID=A0ABU6QGT1_9FABA|nr:hypothetical protein [Stylosanthes scabra]